MLAERPRGNLPRHHHHHDVLISTATRCRRENENAAIGKGLASKWEPHLLRERRGVRRYAEEIPASERIDERQ